MASISQRGSVWRVRVRVKGKLLTKTLDSEAEAAAWAQREEARLVAGETPEQIRRTPSSITVADLFDRYAREVSPAKGGGRWEAIRLTLIARTLKGVAVDIGGADLAEWRDARLRQVSASSVNRELNLISAVFTHAMKEWRLPITVNPAHGIKWPKKPHPRKRRVSDAERAAIVAALGWDGASEPQETAHLVAWAFVLALETMMRQGEILALTWEHVHADRKFCHLPKTKNGDERDVPLSTRAVALFGLLKPGTGCTRVCDVNPGTFGIYFRRAVKAAGIVGLHFHDTRREALTRAAEKITNPAELARASGHRGMSQLMIYYRPSVEDIADKLG